MRLKNISLLGSFIAAVFVANISKATRLDQRISISTAKETITRQYKIDTSELTEGSSCEQIDTFLKKHDIQMTGLNEELISAEDGIICTSERDRK